MNQHSKTIAVDNETLGASARHSWNLLSIKSSANGLSKKQQMQWTPKGAHLLLQTRTRVLDDELDNVFRDWYPKFRPEPTNQPNCCH